MAEDYGQVSGGEYLWICETLSELVTVSVFLLPVGPKLPNFMTDL